MSPVKRNENDDNCLWLTRQKEIHAFTAYTAFVIELQNDLISYTKSARIQ